MQREVVSSCKSARRWRMLIRRVRPLLTVLLVILKTSEGMGALKLSFRERLILTAIFSRHYW